MSYSNSRSIVYFGSNKDRFQLQFPDALCQRLGVIPKDFTLKSQRKGVKRFWTPFITEKLTQLQRVCDEREELIVAGRREEGTVKDFYSGCVSLLLLCTDCDMDSFIALSRLESFGSMCWTIGCFVLISSHFLTWRWSWRVCSSFVCSSCISFRSYIRDS